MDQRRQINLDQNKTFIEDNLSNPTQAQPLPSIQTQQIGTTTDIVVHHRSEFRDSSSNLSNHPEPLDKFIDNLAEEQEACIP